MKMSKRIIMLLLAAMMALSFCACDTYYNINVSTTEEDTTEPPSTKPAYETGVYTTVAKEETFDYTDGHAIAFHGTADPWAATDGIASACARQGIPLKLTEGANHSLETGDVAADLKTLSETMEILRRFLSSDRVTVL